MFERDPGTGGLALAGHLEADLAGASLAWDGERRRPIAHDCGVWRSFRLEEDRPAGTPEDLATDGDPVGCGRLLVDAPGGFAWRVGDSGVDAFSGRPDSGLRFEGNAPVAELKGAAIGGAGRLYAAGADGLLTIRRDDWTGVRRSPDGGEVGDRVAGRDAARGRPGRKAAAGGTPTVPTYSRSGNRRRRCGWPRCRSRRAAERAALPTGTPQAAPSAHGWSGRS